MPVSTAAASLLLLAGRVAAQKAAISLADDTAILQGFAAQGNNAEDYYLATWVASDGGLCDDAGFDDHRESSWKGVMCCASYDGRTCAGTNVRRVSALILNSRGGVSGDVAALGGLVELIYLDLGNTAVFGDVAPLGALTQLTTLRVYETAAHGDAAPLRAIPGLGAGWTFFTACSAGNAWNTADFGGCPAGTSAHAGGASYLGADECACCAGSRKVRDPANGACAEAVDPGEGSWGPAWGLEGPESANGSAAPRLLGSVLAACCSVWLFGL